MTAEMDDDEMDEIDDEIDDILLACLLACDGMYVCAGLLQFPDGQRIRFGE
jgi:hypothetical protein